MRMSNRKRKHDSDVEEWIPNSFLIQNRRLLKNFSFKFEGLDHQLMNDFTRIVKDLGATVCENADYILTDHVYFLKNKKRSDLYSVGFLLDAVQNEELPDIEPYKFSFDDPIRENEGIETNKNSNKRINGNSNEETLIENYATSNGSEDESISEKDISLKNGDCSKNSSTTNKVTFKRKLSFSTESLKFVEAPNIENTKESSKTIKEKNCINKSSPKKVNKKHSNSSDISSNSSYVPSSESDSSSDIIINKRINENTPVNTKSEKHNKSRITRSSDKIDLNEENTNISPSRITRSFKNTRNASNISTQGKISNKKKDKGASKWIDTKNNFDKVTKVIKREQSEQCDSNSIEVENDEEEEILFRKEWWKNHPVPEEQACTFPHCTFEPERHIKHNLPSRMLSTLEKKILLKYLITRKKIHQGKGTSIYEKMHVDGYLKHRSIESLRNCFRRTIFNNLDLFNLPQNIVDELLSIEKKR